MNKMLKDKKIIFLLVTPGLLVFTFCVFLPIVLSFYFSMTDWKGIGKINFIGLDNYKELIFNDNAVKYSLRNSFILAFAIVFIQSPFCIIFAMMLDKIGGKLEKLFRALLFIPCVVSIVVTSKMWMGIFDAQFGLLNKLLDFFNLGLLKRGWLGDPKLVLWCIIIMVVWQGFGWAMLIYYAGIKTLPKDLYEAAKLDGAGGWQTFTAITLPLLRPVTEVIVILGMISGLKQMEMVYLTTNGGPGNVSQFLANYLYSKAFGSYQYGYGNAISILFVIICLLIRLLLNRIFNKDKTDY